MCKNNQKQGKKCKKLEPLRGGLEPPTYRLTADRATGCAIEASYMFDGGKKTGTQILI